MPTQNAALFEHKGDENTSTYPTLHVSWTMRYFPLSPRKNYIRLVVLKPGHDDDPIECELILHDLDRPLGIKFYALSYTWGDPPDSESIRLKGEEFNVRPNLKEALKCLRWLFIDGNNSTKKTLHLWIDAICINQKDLRECSEQVLRISDICQAAVTTMIWLGEGTSSSDKAIDFMLQNEKRAYEMAPELLQARNYREEYLALVGQIFLRAWWQRIWIVQEVTVSPGLLVVCGRRTIPWELLIRFLAIVEEYHKPAIGEVLRSVRARENDLKEDLGLTLHGIRRKWHESGLQPVSQLLIGFLNWLATKPIDKVYGILAMAAEAKHPALTPDYRSTPQYVYMTVTKFIIESHQKLDFILIAAGMRQLVPLPSWTPDLSVPGFKVPTPLKGRFRVLDRYLYSAAKEVPMPVSFSDDGAILYANGIKADKVQDIASYWDPSLSLEDYEAKLAKGTIEAWAKIVHPVAEKISRRYGPGFMASMAIGKLLTADRKFDRGFNPS